MAEPFKIYYDIDVSVLAPLQAIANEFQKRLAEVVATASNQLQAEWSKEATIALKNPSGYIQAIDSQELTPLHIIVENNHKAVWFLEMGVAPFDLKKMLETSSKVKINKKTGRRYIRIPFDHRVKDLISAGIDKGDIRNLSGTRIQSIINHEDGSKKFNVQWGDRLQAGTVGIRSKTFPVTGDLARKINSFTIVQASKPAEPYSMLRYTWKSSPFQNAVKMIDYKGKTSGMKTFRTISEDSDPSSWIHSGITASHIAEKAVNTVKPLFIQQVGATIAEALKEAGFE